MSENLPKLFTTQFSTVLEMKLQQRMSKLRGRCMEGFHVGKQASPIQYIGAVQMKAPAGRFAPIGRHVLVGDVHRHGFLAVSPKLGAAFRGPAHGCETVLGLRGGGH